MKFQELRLLPLFTISILLFTLFLSSPSFIYAHPGRTASDGCHYCRTNCDSWGVPWNTRHCHGDGIVAPVSRRAAPVSTPSSGVNGVSTGVYPAPTSTPIPPTTGSVIGALASLVIIIGLPIWILIKIIKWLGRPRING